MMLAIRRGDGDAFGAAVEDRRRLLQARLHALAIGDVEHDADQTAVGFAWFAIGGFVKDDVAHAAVSVPDFGFVHLRTRVPEQFVVGSLVAIGQFAGGKVVDGGADHLAA
jgi:predicted mannosyl-3-phosphoglycerate phosphatase (HAD superfamily)